MNKRPYSLTPIDSDSRGPLLFRIVPCPKSFVDEWEDDLYDMSYGLYYGDDYYDDDDDYFHHHTSSDSDFSNPNFVEFTVTYDNGTRSWCRTVNGKYFLFRENAPAEITSTGVQDWFVNGIWMGTTTNIPESDWRKTYMEFYVKYTLEE